MATDDDYWISTSFSAGLFYWSDEDEILMWVDDQAAGWKDESEISSEEWMEGN